MSFLSPPNGATAVGETVVSFKDYPAAQAAVSKLIAGDVPARDIAIVGAGLRSIERVTGKLGYARAALSGTMNGVLIGLLFAAVFVLGTPEAPIQLFLGVLLVGVALGMLLSLVSYSIVRRRRDYASVMQVVADHYEVTVQANSIHRARQLLQAERPRPTTKVLRADEPPQYGERIDQARPQSVPPVAAEAAVAEPAAGESAAAESAAGESVNESTPVRDDSPGDADTDTSPRP